MERKFYIRIAIVLLLFFSFPSFSIGGEGNGFSIISVNKKEKTEILTTAIEVTSAADLDVNSLQIFSANPNLIKVTDISILGNIIQVNVDLTFSSKGDDEEIIDVIEFVGIDNITGVFINLVGQQNLATAYIYNSSSDGDEHHTDQINHVSSASERLIVDHQKVEQVPSSAASTGSSAFVKDMLVYPNPAKDELSVVTVGEILGKSIKIIDLSGKVHKEIEIIEKSYKTIIDITDLPAGIYLVNLTALNGKSYIQKFYKVD